MGIQAVVDPIIAGLASAGSAVGGALGLGAAAAPEAAAVAAPLVAGAEGAAALAPTALGAAGAAEAAGGLTGAGLTAADALGAGAGLAGAGAGLAGTGAAIAPTAAAPVAAAIPAAATAAPAVAAPALSAVTGAAPAGVASALPATTAAADTTGITGAATSQLPGVVGTGAAGGGASSLAPISLSTPTPLAAPSASEALSPVSSISAPTPSLVDQGVSGAKNVGSSILHGVEHHPLNALEGAAFGASVLRGLQPPPYEGALSAQAHQLGQQGGQLESYLSSGTLPPGMQASINAAQDAAEATIRSQYAQRGMSGSSAEAQDVQNARERSAAQGQQLALQLFQQGLNEVQLSDQLYSELMQIQVQQDAELMQGITGFSSSLAGLGRPPAATAG